MTSNRSKAWRKRRELQADLERHPEARIRALPDRSATVILNRQFSKDKNK